MSVLSRPHFHDEAAAFEHVEKILWPQGATCPHCGNAGKIYELNGVVGKTGKPRHGLKKCGECRKQFTVRVGTIFESSHIPLHKWLQAIHLMTSSKKGISSNQLHRVLEITLKSAWFLSHRIREAMRSGEFEPMGGAGMTVEADETYFGKKDVVTKRTKRGKPSHSSQRAVVSLVERGGKVRSFFVERADIETVTGIVRNNVAKETALYTDESSLYNRVEGDFAARAKVKHTAGEYVRYEDGVAIHTNTVEGYYSIFKRGMRGVYQHCGERHLHRYLAEFDFRYNNRIKTGCDDSERSLRTLQSVKGKRLTYRQSHT